MLRNLVLSASCFLIAAPAFAARSTKPAARVAKAAAHKALAPTGEIVLHFQTDNGIRKADHVVPMSWVDAIRDGGGKALILKVKGHELTTKAVRYTGPKGELSTTAIPPIGAMEDASGEQLQAAIARKAKLTITPMTDNGISREVLRSANLHLIEDRTELDYSYNPSFFARNSWRKAVPLSQVRSVVKAGLGYNIATKEHGPLPNRERSLSLPWASSFGKDEIANVYRVIGSEELLSQRAINDYVAGKTDRLHFETARSDTRTGTDLANALRARLVRNLGQTGVQKAEWYELEQTETTAKAKKAWGL